METGNDFNSFPKFSQSALKWAFAGLKTCVFELKTRVKTVKLFIDREYRQI